MSEKPGNQVRYVASVPKSSFVINSLFKDLATVVHSGARQGGCSRDISAIDFRVVHADGFARATRKKFLSDVGLKCQSGHWSSAITARHPSDG
jgi:hypothetical protein